MLSSQSENVRFWFIALEALRFYGLIVPMRRIDSVHNPVIRQLKRLLAKGSSTQMLIEGEHLVEEALASGIRVGELLVTARRWERQKQWFESLEDQGVRMTIVSEAAMRQLSTVETAPGILAVAELPHRPGGPPAPLALAAFAFSMNDPGNLGTLVRTAEAAGLEFLACTADTADAAQPKVVRASMGSIFRLPVFRVADPGEYLRAAVNQAVSLYGLQVRAGTPLNQVSVKRPAIILVGSESHGLPPGLPFYEPVTIPMSGRVESLNAAVAAAVCFYYFSFFSR